MYLLGLSFILTVAESKEKPGFIRGGVEYKRLFSCSNSGNSRIGGGSLSLATSTGVGHLTASEIRDDFCLRGLRFARTSLSGYSSSEVYSKTKRITRV
jgi:hypothetical protein